MSKASRVTSSVIEGLRSNMQPLSEKCQRDVIEGEGEDAKVVGTKVCEYVNGDVCKVYAFPDAKWRIGNCVMATHVETEEQKQAAKIRVGQQKQVKKSKKKH